MGLSPKQLDGFSVGRDSQTNLEPYSLNQIEAKNDYDVECEKSAVV